MPTVEANGVSIYAESFGMPGDPPLLLINGLTSQLLSWPQEFCEAFVDRGFFVIRFDNRDVGLSSKFVDGPEYTLSDMADDCVAVLEHFDAAPAHVMGISMGGMIAQTLAIEHSDVVASLVSYASSTGAPEVGLPTAEAVEAILAPEPANREEAAANGVAGKKVWGTPETWSEEEWGEFSARNFDRSPPNGAGPRQYAAILASGNRDGELAKIDIPTLVIHGSADPLITSEGGKHTAAVIPNARYVEIEGMRHDLPITEWPHIVQLVTMHAAQAATAS